MSKITFVVVSTPRSGTLYTSELFKRMGIECGHEYYYDPETVLHPAVFNHSDHEIVGESNWMTAPYIHRLPFDTIILHQIRDPLSTLNSLLDTGHLEVHNTAWPYMGFIRRNVSFPWADAPLPIKAMFFWSYWHRMIEMKATGFKYYRYRVEDADPDQLRRWVGRSALASNIQAAIEMPRVYNHWSKYNPTINKADLSRDVLELARRYGYKDY